MSNLYRKVAVASVCTALGFALGANKEAKAATFTLTIGNSGNDGTSFLVADRNQDGLGDFVYGGVPLPVGTYYSQEYKAFYEFNIAKLSLASNTVISSAIFQGTSNTPIGGSYWPILFGYIGNGQANLSDFQAGTYLNSNRPTTNFPAFSYDVTSFIQQIISNNNAFAGIGFRRPYVPNQAFYQELNKVASLTIETVDVAEPVPEPTTIFGSAIALSLGGWLKRKKSSRQNKTTPQA